MGGGASGIIRRAVGGMRRSEIPIDRQRSDCSVPSARDINQLALPRPSAGPSPLAALATDRFRVSIELDFLDAPSPEIPEV